MSVEQVGPGVFRLVAGVVNCYLIEDGGELTFIDTAWPRSWDALQSAVAEIGRSPGDVRAVVLTHGHPDHLGSAERARRSWGVPVMAYRGEVERVKGRSKGSSPFTLVPGLLPQLWRPSTFGFVLHATARGFLTPTWVSEVAAFDDGDVLDVPGRPRAVFTPGHTEGHTSFHLPERGIFFAGDTLLTLDPLTRKEGPCLPPDSLNADPGQVRKSLLKLAGIEAGTLLPGHGDPWQDGLSAAVERAREVA